MGLVVEVRGAQSLPGDLSVLGLPAVVGTEEDVAPRLLGGAGLSVGGVELPQVLDPAWCKRLGFTAKSGQVMDLPISTSVQVVVVGLGPPDALNAERWRKAAAGLVRATGEGGVAAFLLPSEPLGENPSDIAAAITEGAVLAAYRFESYRSKANGSGIDRLFVVGEDSELGSGVRRGQLAADAVCFARDLINTPPSDLAPRRFAEIVTERLEGVARTSVEVWDEDRIAQEHLGGLMGVARGATEPPRLIKVHYEPSHPVRLKGHVPHVVLVGKGITFDSGGLSLKTAEGMMTMKTDMSGAAAVLAVLSACADLDVGVEVTAIAPCTENMPGGSAIKPGDVLTARNGKTIEVLNTDAEGRLVLADGLSLAAELSPDAVIDVATLTGAAVVALGSSIGALFGNNELLMDKVRDAGNRAAEKLWPLPLPEEYADHIESEVADMKNIGVGGEAGSISAAMLLSRFTGQVPWAHLDIAGPARSKTSSGYLTKGGTGFGVRTLLEVLASYRSSDDSSS